MSNAASHAAHLALALLLAPLFVGVINRVKAKVGGRRGKPLLQLYFDIAKLLRKSEVISTSCTWVFQVAPSVSLASAVLALSLLPLAHTASPLAFQGDFMVAAYLLGMGRFVMSLAALDTASPFEGMGASREAAFSALAEPCIFLCFLCLAHSARQAGHGDFLSLSAMFAKSPLEIWSQGRPELLLIPLVLFFLLLVENCRIPIDDPTTHLELTMIHEVIILDHSGPNLAFILYGAALKLWFFAVLLVNTTLPALDGLPVPAQWGVDVAAVFAVAVLVGLVESSLARVRMYRVSPLLCCAAALAGLALTLTLTRG